MHKVLVVALVAAMLAGCSGSDPKTDGPTTPTSPPVEQTPVADHVAGVVVDELIVPVADARVTVVGRDRSGVTDAQGKFSIDLGAPTSEAVLVSVAADGFVPTNITVSPADLASARLQILHVPLATPTHTTLHFQGNLECAFEALIISPSCDSAIVFVNDGIEPVAGRPLPEPFRQNATFGVYLTPAWRSVVVDVVFDSSAAPLLDGLRITARGTSDPDQLNDYQQYGRFTAPESFTFRLDPAGEYTDGTSAVPANLTAVLLDVYPQSLLYHPGGIPFLGVGFGQNVKFDVYATVFDFEAAPEGFTLQ